MPGGDGEMSRTKGARDLKPRKTRSDKKNRYKRNRMGNLVPYVPKRKRTDPLKCRFVHLKQMSKEGYKHWSVKVRANISKFVVYPFPAIRVMPDQICTIEAIEQLALEQCGFEGRFQFQMPGHSKNSFHCSYRKKALVEITEHEDGLKAKVLQTWNLKRYWFWRGK